METLEVVFDRTRFTADPDQDGLTWGIYKARYNGGEIVIKGKLDTEICKFDMVFQVTGKWVHDPKYGRQFQFSSYTRAHPNGKWGIMAFLTQADGIGSVTAEKIYDAYGEDSIKAVTERPGEVSDKVGVRFTVAKAAAEKLKHIVGEMGVKMPLIDLFKGTRISARVIDKIIKAKWNDPVARIKKNPFILTAFRGVAFKQCDGLRLNLELPKDMPERIRAAAYQAFYENSDKTWLTHRQVYDTMSRLLEMRVASVDEALDSLLEDELIVNSSVYELGVDGLLALKECAEDEREVAQHLAMRLQADAPKWPIEEIQNDPDLTDHQKEVIVNNMRAGGTVTMISGSPGTGKTHCLGKILKYFQGSAYACAPTGKAAQRLTQSLYETGLQATTIHRMLQPLPIDGGWVFQIDGGNGGYVDADIVVIDEASMLGAWLAARTLRAIRPGTYIIFVGDKNQLPPVGPGTMMRDLEELDFKPFTQVHRNSGKIVETCAKIRDNKPFLLVPTKTPGHNPRENNLQLVQTATDEQSAAAVEAIAKDLVNIPYVNDVKQDVQFLTATHNNPHVGRIALNKAIQSILNPNGGGEHEYYRVGDKVICTDNVHVNADGGTKDFIANGELGVVIKSLKKQIVVKLYTTGKEYMIHCGPDRGNGWDLAWCITGHKFQGSQCPLVVTVLGNDYGTSMVADRSWIYTAWSRAEVCSVTISNNQHIKSKVKCNRIWDRKSLILNHMEAFNVPQKV